MAKIDTSTIEGFDTMTPEQKVDALTVFEMPDADYTGYVKKELFDKTASEAADWKKKHNALLSEDEQKKLANEQTLSEMQEKLANLEKEKTVSGYKASLVSQGYDEKLASETAQAMVDGDMAKVFVNQGKFLEAKEKAIKAELLKKTPTPPAGGGGDGMTKDKFLKLSTKEQNEYIKDHPDWMKELK